MYIPTSTPPNPAYDYHPWLPTNASIYSVSCEYIAFFIPRTVFSATVPAWDSWVDEKDATTLHYRHGLEIFGTLCGTMGTQGQKSNTDGELQNITTITAVPGSGSRSNEVVGYLLLASVATLHGRDDKKYEITEEDNEQTIRTKTKALAAVKAKRDPPWILFSQLELNKSRAAAKREGKEAHRARPVVASYWDTLDYERWYAWAQDYVDNKLICNMDIMDGSTITHRRNPGNPFRVFDLENACRLARFAGADPAYYEPTNYVAQDEATMALVVCFPNGGLTTYRVRPNDLFPEELKHYVFPDTLRPILLDTDPEVLSLAMKKGHPHDPDALQRAKDALRGGGCTTFVDNSLDGLRQRFLPIMEGYDKKLVNTEEKVLREEQKRVTEEVKKMLSLDDAGRNRELNRLLPRTFLELPETARKRAEEEISNISKERQSTRKVLLEEFMRTFDERGNIPPVLRSICKWMKEFIATNPKTGFCMPSKRAYSNLSTFGNEMASFISAIELLQSVHSVHAHMFTVMIAAMHVYNHCDFHANPLMLGSPASGKSYILNQLKAYCIPDTVFSFGNFSSKADMTQDAAQLNHAIVTYDEAPAQVLLPNGSSSKGATARDSGVTSDASEFRSRLTSGKVNYRRNIKKPDGSFGTEILSFDLNNVFCMAMNAIDSDFPAPILSRFMLLRVLVQMHRPDISTLAKVNARLDSKRERQKQAFINKWRRFQALSALIWNLVHVGLLKKPDITMAASFVVSALERGPMKRVLAANDLRHAQRVNQMMEVLTVYLAVVKFYDSPMAIERQKRKMEARGGTSMSLRDALEEILAIEPLLVCPIEIAVFTLTLLGHQYESPNMHNVASTVKTMGFKQTKDSAAVRRGGVIPPESKKESKDDEKKKKGGGKGKKSDTESVSASQPRITDGYMGYTATEGFDGEREGKEEKKRNRRGEGKEEKKEEKEEDQKQSTLIQDPYWRISLPPLGQNSRSYNYSDEGNIDRLAKRLRDETLCNRLSIDAIKGVLREWESHQIKDKDHDDIVNLGLKFEGTLAVTALVHKELTIHSTPDKVKRAMQECVDRANVNGRTFVIGSICGEVPYAWEIITAKPPSNTKDPLKLSNPEWCISREIERALSYAFDTAEHEEKSNGLKHLRSAEKYWRVDVPIDPLQMLSRMRVCHANDDVLRAIGFDVNLTLTRKCIALEPTFDKQWGKLQRMGTSIYPKDVIEHKDEDEEEEGEGEGEEKEEKRRRDPTPSPMHRSLSSLMRGFGTLGDTDIEEKSNRTFKPVGTNRLRVESKEEDKEEKIPTHDIRAQRMLEARERKQAKDLETARKEREEAEKIRERHERKEKQKEDKKEKKKKEREEKKKEKSSSGSRPKRKRERASKGSRFLDTESAKGRGDEKEPEPEKGWEEVATEEQKRNVKERPGLHRDEDEDGDEPDSEDLEFIAPEGSGEEEEADGTGEEEEKELVPHHALLFRQEIEMDKRIHKSFKKRRLRPIATSSSEDNESIKTEEKSNTREEEEETAVTPIVRTHTPSPLPLTVPTLLPAPMSPTENDIFSDLT